VLQSAFAWLNQPVSKSRWIQASAWAAVVFGIFQLLALPMAVSRESTGWQFHPETLATLLLTFGCAWLAFRRLPIGILLLGLIGGIRLLAFAAFMVRIVTGHATDASTAPAFFLVLALTSPCAVLWITGSISLIRQTNGGDAVAPPQNHPD
jgi:hypothetical protein